MRRTGASTRYDRSGSLTEAEAADTAAVPTSEIDAGQSENRRSDPLRPFGPLNGSGSGWR